MELNYEGSMDVNYEGCSGLGILLDGEIGVGEIVEIKIKIFDL